MPAEVVVIAEPWFEAFLQRVDGVEVPVGQSRQEAEADGAEEAFDLAAGRGVEGLAVEQRAADARAGFGQVVRPEGRAVIGVLCPVALCGESTDPPDRLREGLRSPPHNLLA
jgi:hypothetical protein